MRYKLNQKRFSYVFDVFRNFNKNTCRIKQSRYVTIIYILHNKNGKRVIPIVRVKIMTHEAPADCEKSHEQTIDTFQRVLYTIFPTTFKKVIYCKNIYFFESKKLMIKLVI
jgi:hypothetical protein